MHNFDKTPKSNAQKAFDALPYWMRQMMQDKVQKCLVADADEQRQMELSIQIESNSAGQSPEPNICVS